MALKVIRKASNYGLTSLNKYLESFCRGYILFLRFFMKAFSAVDRDDAHFEHANLGNNLTAKHSEGGKSSGKICHKLCEKQ